MLGPQAASSKEELNCYSYPVSCLHLFLKARSLVGLGERLAAILFKNLRKRCQHTVFSLHLQLSQHFGDVDGVEGRTGEALLAKVVERGPDMNERLAVDDEVAVVESLGFLDRKRVLVLRVEHTHRRWA